MVAGGFADQIGACSGGVVALVWLESLGEGKKRNEEKPRETKGVRYSNFGQRDEPEARSDVGEGGELSSDSQE